MSRLSRVTLFSILLLVGGTFAAGCYTVLRHPEPQVLVAEDSGARKACADCHVDSEFYHDAFDPGFYGFGGYWEYPTYSDYYFRPWWYRDYWYYTPEPHTVVGTPVETRGQHMWGGGTRREIQPGVTPLAPGSAGTGPAAPSGSSPTGSQAPSGGTGGEKPRDEKPAEGSRTGNRRETGRREIGTPKPPPPPAEPTSPEPAPTDEDEDDDGGTTP